MTLITDALSAYLPPSILVFFIICWSCVNNAFFDHPNFKCILTLLCFWPTNYVWAIELSRLGLEFIGLWPKNDEVAKKNLIPDLRVAIVFVILVPAVIPHLCSLTRVWGDMILMMDNLLITGTLLLIVLKLIVMWWKRTAFSSILKMMLEDWIALKVDAEMYVMARRAHTARLIIICEYVTMMLGFTMVIILPTLGLPFRQLTNLTDRSRPLPLQAYYFYDTDMSPQYELTYIIQIVMIFFACIVYSSVDAFLGLSIFHLCGQLENFRHRLVRWTLCNDFDNALRRNVETHRRLIRFVNDIEDTFSVMMLILVLYFGAIFSFFAFLLLAIMSSNDTTDISFSRKCFALLGASTLFTQMFLYCGAGEILKEHSEAIYREIYDLDWYKLEPKNARSIMLLMIRTKEPFCITAGKIFPLTMTTFCKLLKTTASYMSFLLAMQD